MVMTPHRKTRDSNPKWIRKNNLIFGFLLTTFRYRPYRYLPPLERNHRKHNCVPENSPNCTQKYCTKLRVRIHLTPYFFIFIFIFTLLIWIGWAIVTMVDNANEFNIFKIQLAGRKERRPLHKQPARHWRNYHDDGGKNWSFLRAYYYGYT